MRKCSQVADTSKTEEQLQHVYTQYIIAGADPGGPRPSSTPQCSTGSRKSTIRPKLLGRISPKLS